jgi:hypothetical protein
MLLHSLGGKVAPVKKCEEHDELLSRLRRVEKILYVLLGVGVGSGLLQLSQISSF